MIANIFIDRHHGSSSFTAWQGGGVKTHYVIRGCLLGHRHTCVDRNSGTTDIAERVVSVQWRVVSEDYWHSESEYGA